MYKLNYNLAQLGIKVDKKINKPMTKKIINAIDDNLNAKRLCGKKEISIPDNVDIVSEHRQRAQYECGNQYHNQSKRYYLSSIIFKAESTIREYFIKKANYRYKLDESKNRGGAEAYLNKAMAQLAILRDKLVNETFTIDDVQHFVDETESVGDWELIKLVINLVYSYSKRGEVDIMRSKDYIIADKEFKLNAFCEREEARQSRQKSRVEITSKALKAKADSNARYFKSIFKEINDQGIVSLRDMADELNHRGIACSKGGQKWFATTVRLVKKRISDIEQEEAASRGFY